MITALVADISSGSWLAWVTTGWILFLALATRPISPVWLSIGFLAVVESWTTECWRQSSLEWQSAYVRDIGKLARTQPRMLESSLSQQAKSCSYVLIQRRFPFGAHSPSASVRHGPCGLSRHQNSPDRPAFFYETFPVASRESFPKPFAKILRNPQDLIPDDCLRSKTKLAETAAGNSTETRAKTPAPGFRLRFNVDRVRSVFGGNLAHVFDRFGLCFVIASLWRDYANYFVRPGRERIQELHVAFSNGCAWLLFQRNPDLRRATHKQEHQNRNEREFYHRI